MLNSLLFARSWQLSPSIATLKMERTVCAVTSVVTWLSVLPPHLFCNGKDK